MADRFVRPALAVLLALAAASQGSAHTRHHATSTHRATHVRTRHAAAPTHHATSRRNGHAKGKATPAEHRGATPAGVSAVPAGGLKVYCPARRSPLLIRKSTQGSGTTVTVVCR